ncbi:MAG: SpoIID/LytB domain-containing protein [Actinomycetota bacterium]
MTTGFFRSLPTPSGRRLAAALVAAGALLLLVAPTPVAAQEVDSEVVISGHGWGHGRGMGQYGAYGYAQQGWTSSQILDHYYGGTTAGQVPATASVDPDAVRVDLRYMRNRTTIVALGSGTIVLLDTAGTEVARINDGAVKLHPIADGYEVQTGATCDGPFATIGALAMDTVRVTAESTADGSDGLIQACGTSQRTWYEGELSAVKTNGATRTVNTVTIEQYLRGVVPNEMPALWPTAALEAQAVAARSYAMAGDTRQQPYADTCDTILCQVYDGAYTERGGSFRSAHHDRTDAAIAATAGLVRLRGDGSVARTEFSSSTGGYTAGGEFPAVIDEGDSIAANPNHDWETTVPRSTIEARYGLGTLRSAEVVSRNGHGSEGGRVVNVRFTFDRGTVFETGNRVRQILGLKSDWFTFGSGSGAEIRATDDGRYINEAYVRLGGRDATNAELVAWHDAVESGRRASLTLPLAADNHFVAVLIDDLYGAAFGRSADAGGRAYWRSAIDEGLNVEALGVLLLGSEEYYVRSGGTDRDFLAALYQSVLGRTPDEAGIDYWEAQLAAGRATRLDVASGFYTSVESRGRRVDLIYNRLLGVDAPATVRATLADQLLAVDERVVAAEIAASGPAYSAWSD